MWELITLTAADTDDAMRLQERMVRALPDPRWYFTGSAEEMAEELEQGIGVGVRQDGRLVALAACRLGETSGDHAYALCVGEPSAAHTLDFLDIMVDPDFRRQGIHSACIRHFREAAEKNGCSSIYCTVDPDNIPSRRSFEKAGFRPVCEKPAYDGRPRVYYRLALCAE